MVLSVACRKAFVGENVVVHRNDSAAAAAKEAAKRDNRRRFTVAVHDARAVIVVDDVQMLVLEIAAHGRMAGREILTVLRAADADAVAVLEVFRRLHKRRHQLIAANGRIVGRHIGLRHTLVAHNAAGDDHIARVQLFTDRHAAAKAQEGVGLAVLHELHENQLRFRAATAAGDNADMRALVVAGIRRKHTGLSGKHAVFQTAAQKLRGVSAIIEQWIANRHDDIVADKIAVDLRQSRLVADDKAAGCELICIVIFGNNFLKFGFHFCFLPSSIKEQRQPCCREPSAGHLPDTRPRGRAYKYRLRAAA